MFKSFECFIRTDADISICSLCLLLQHVDKHVDCRILQIGSKSVYSLLVFDSLPFINIS